MEERETKQVNLQEFKYRYAVGMFFCTSGFVLAILMTYNIISGFVAKQDTVYREGFDIKISDIHNLPGLILTPMIVLLVLSMVGAGIIGYLYLKKYNEEWSKTNEVLEEIQKGLPPTSDYESPTEFKAIFDAAHKVGLIYDGLQELREKISRGEFDDNLEVLNMDNDLGKSGITMLKNLKELTESNNLRLWVNESLNELSELMRSDRKDIDLFSQNILSYIVRKTNCNLGALYVVNDSEASEPYMEMINCYAYNKRKLVESRIYKGQGLIGRLWQEKLPIVLTEIPDDYCKIITSVGEAKPRSLVLLPMMQDQKIVGAIEMGSFQVLNNHQIEFVQKAIDSFASVYSNIKTEENTRQLLEEAQQLSEETRASEEEIRQNMEELQAIQEELLRKEKETDKLMQDAKERERALQEEIDRLQLELSNV